MYGLVAICATVLPSTMNCTSTTPLPPALSIAVADSIVSPVSIAPAVGAVSVTVGGTISDGGVPNLPSLS